MEMKIILSKKEKKTEVTIKSLLFFHLMFSLRLLADVSEDTAVYIQDWKQTREAC